MYVSRETLEQTEKRLKEVIRQANFKIYDGAYFFEEFPLDKYKFDRNALAAVRDEEVWSQLVEASDEKKNKELFKVFSFHFKDGADNSGFVGWLASTIKSRVGSGVFVVCGQNTNLGGIFDYLGCPYEVKNQVINLINELRDIN
ncbi:MAG TPA: DUF6196 family protein [Patescibacteria group bacterium]